MADNRNSKSKKAKKVSRRWKLLFISGAVNTIIDIVFPGNENMVAMILDIAHNILIFMMLIPFSYIPNYIYQKSQEFQGLLIRFLPNDIPPNLTDHS